MIVILMGVSGTGKTTLGKLLSDRTGWPFLDGDDFHSTANKVKMGEGIPLTDSDRSPWLADLHREIQTYSRANTSMILACSALKEEYRVTLRGTLSQDQIRFVLLDASPGKIESHLRDRAHEYMNPSLLASQLNTLQRPTDAWVISVEGTPEESLELILAHLQDVESLPTT